jgi:hypothetical protein
MNPSPIQLHHATAHQAERTTARRRPASHAFTVPVVRELAPQVAHIAAAGAW